MRTNFSEVIGFVGARSTKPDRSGHRDAAGNSNGEKAQRQPQWRGKGGKSNGQRGRGQGQHQQVADEAANEQDGKGKGKPNGKTGGKPGGKANGKAGKRKREGKGDTETTPSKKKRDDVKCFNCGEQGHFQNQCKQARRITDGSAVDENAQFDRGKGGEVVHRERWFWQKAGFAQGARRKPASRKGPKMVYNGLNPVCSLQK